MKDFVKAYKEMADITSKQITIVILTMVKALQDHWDKMMDIERKQRRK